MNREGAGMTASRTASERASPDVTVRCKVPGGPWFVGLGGPDGPEVELGPYENPAVAREDATKLRQFLAYWMTPPLSKPTPADRNSAPESNTGRRQGGPRNVRKDES